MNFAFDKLRLVWWRLLQKGQVWGELNMKGRRMISTLEISEESNVTKPAGLHVGCRISFFTAGILALAAAAVTGTKWTVWKLLRKIQQLSIQQGWMKVSAACETEYKTHFSLLSSKSYLGWSWSWSWSWSRIWIWSWSRSWSRSRSWSWVRGHSAGPRSHWHLRATEEALEFTKHF